MATTSRPRPTRTASYSSSLPPIIDAHERTPLQMPRKDHRGSAASRIPIMPTSPLAMAQSRCGGIPGSKQITGYATSPYLRPAIQTAAHTPTSASVIQNKQIITPELRSQSRKTLPISPPRTPDGGSPIDCESTVQGTSRNGRFDKKSIVGKWVGMSAADGVVESGMGVGGISGACLDGDAGGVSRGGYESGIGCGEGRRTIGDYERRSSSQDPSPPPSPFVGICSLDDSDLNAGSTYAAPAGDDLELDAVFEMDEEAQGKVSAQAINRRDSTGSGVDTTVDSDAQNTVDPEIDQVEIGNLGDFRESMKYSARNREHHVGGLYFGKPLLLGLLSSEPKPAPEGAFGSTAGPRNRSESMCEKTRLNAVKYRGFGQGSTDNKPFAIGGTERRNTFTNFSRDIQPGPDPRVQGIRYSATPSTPRCSLPTLSTLPPDASKTSTLQSPLNKPASPTGSTKNPRDRRSLSSSGIREFLDTSNKAIAVNAIEIPRVDPRATRQGFRGVAIGRAVGSGSGWNSPAGSYQPRSVFG